MSDEKDIGEALVWVAGTKASCKIADVLGEMTTRHDGDKLLLEFASMVKLRSMPRSKDYLAHFLNGSGKDKTFELTDLLKDVGVASIVRRHFNSPLSRSTNVVTVGQRSYRDLDWTYSLGTYFIYYIDIGEYKNVFGQTTRHVLAWGEDTYQWAPNDAKRFTQCLHQAASRLQRVSENEVQKAATFKMIAEDAIIDTASGMAAMHLKHQSDHPLFHVAAAKSQIGRSKPQPMCRGQ